MDPIHLLREFAMKMPEKGNEVTDYMTSLLLMLVLQDILIMTWLVFSHQSYNSKLT